MHLLCSHRCSLSTVAFFVEFWLEIESFLKNFKVCFCPQAGMIFVNSEHILEGKKCLLILDNIWHSCHCDTFYVSASLHQQKNEISNCQKYSRLRCLLRVKSLVICFYLGSIFQFKQNIIKVGSKSWLLTCSSNITLSLWIHWLCFEERVKFL